jgi:poly(3-hydroxybutyrate) depolymerase
MISGDGECVDVAREAERPKRVEIMEKWMRLTLGLVAACLLAAQDLPRGQVLERVTLRDNEQQSYSLYLPSKYTPEHSWPILYCLDPGARGRVPVERFAQAAEKSGFLVAGSNNSRNGPIAPSLDAIRAMVADTHARLAIDDTRIYAAGLSGGARLALAWAQSGGIAGAIASSAGFGSATPKQISFRIFATAGVDDFNYDEMYRMSLDLAKMGVPHRFVEFTGGHEWLPAELADEALRFFAGSVPRQSASPSREQARQATRFEHMIREVASAGDPEKRALIGQLIKDSAKDADSSDRRVARRVIGSITVESMERGRALMQERDYGGASRVYETAVLVVPRNAGTWYSLAVAHAGAGNTRRALEALEHASSLGFRDAQRVEGEALFTKLRREARYQAVLRAMKS